MNHLPAPHQQPTATKAGQPETAAAAQAFLADIESIMANSPKATSFRDPTPIPTVGTTPPVTDQPGARRPAMSQRAVDLNTTLLSSSVVIGMTGAAGTGILWASGQASPTVIAWICAGIVAAPAVLSLPILALKSLAKSAKQVVEAAPPTVTNHYSGYVDQRQVNVHTRTTGVIATTRTAIPQGEK